jgi:ferredoxin
MDLRIWIEPGCIECGWCHNLSPEVFVLTQDGMSIRSDARLDGLQSPNHSERAPLTPEVQATLDPTLLQFVVDGCPSKVIHLDPPLVVDLLA